ncbi:hypothetical protein ACIQI8_27640 [Streptomyces sp. NPDC092369]|uniref:hypothetical protein n=1 Tax=Streptomyces sp. NPDC092369 TaxID=3366015 RepID=UPI0037F76031
MSTLESDAQPTAFDAQPTVVHGPLSVARQHGKACIGCGAVGTELTPAGQIRLAGCDEVWPVVTCGCHKTNSKRLVIVADLEACDD